MSKFKIGDRIRRAKDFWSVPEGTEAVVNGIDPSGYATVDLTGLDLWSSYTISDDFWELVVAAPPAKGPDPRLFIPGTKIVRVKNPMATSPLGFETVTVAPTYSTRFDSDRVWFQSVNGEPLNGDPENWAVAPAPAPGSWDPNKPTTTRDGRKVRVLCLDKKCTDFPVVGLLSQADGNEALFQWRVGGRFLSTRESDNDLINPPQVKFINLFGNGPAGRYYDTREAAEGDGKKSIAAGYIATMEVRI